MKTKKNILFVHEVASQAEILSSYLIENYRDVYDVKRIIYFNHKYYKTFKYPETVFDAGCDIKEYKKGVLGQLKTACRLIAFLWKYKNIIFKADIIHFFSGSSFLPGNIDIYFLKKLLRKKIIMEYNGSEIRQPSFSQSINMFYKLSEGCHYFSDVQVRKKISQLQKYFDCIIAPYPEIFLQVQNIISYSKTHTIQFLPHIIDIPTQSNRKYFGHIPVNGSKDFVIIHAPSNKNTKGSIYIQEIIKELQKRYPQIIYKELHNIPRHQVLEEIIHADCVIDQMLIGDFGIFALEALSYGTPVFCFILKEVMQYYPENIPVINANLLNLYSQLDYYIEHKNQLKDIAIHSRRYVEKYNSLEVIGNKYKELIEAMK